MTTPMVAGRRIAVAPAHDPITAHAITTAMARETTTAANLLTVTIAAGRGERTDMVQAADGRVRRAEDQDEVLPECEAEDPVAALGECTVADQAVDIRATGVADPVVALGECTVVAQAADHQAIGVADPVADRGACTVADRLVDRGECMAVDLLVVRGECKDDALQAVVQVLRDLVPGRADQVR